MRYKKTIFLLLLIISGTFFAGAQSVPDYAAIDRHARSAPRKLWQDLPRLTAYLIEPAATDLEKARALYVWITHRISYDLDAYQQGNRRINKNIRDILGRRRAICIGYAQLFQAMCREAGIPCEIIDGYSKGTLTARPALDEPDHAWNSLYLNGAWHLLDATWGSSVVDKKNDFVRSEAAFYFLAAAESFVLNHLPAAPMWQLLDCPVPVKVYAQPPESITRYLNTTDSCYAFRDSLREWVALPDPLKKLRTAQMTYHFNPTADNANELGHSYMDYAGHLSDRADRFGTGEQLDSLILYQQGVIDASEQARHFADTLYNWQRELHISHLINQAVALSQTAGPDTDTENLYGKMKDYLLRARNLIEELPPRSFYARQASQQCRTYLRWVEQRLDN